MKDIEQKTNEVRDLVNKYYDQYIVIADSNSKVVVMHKATMRNSLYLVRKYILELRNTLTNMFGAKCAEKLLKSVLLTDDEMREEAQEIKQKMNEEIPSWLKRMMNVEEDDDDDADDEPCDCDDDSDEDGDDSEAEDEARRKAIDDLINVLRGGISGHGSFDVSLRSE